MTDTEHDSAHRWSARRYVVGGVLLAAMLTSGVGLWASQSMIAGAVVAQGHLRVDSKRKDVSHLEGGVVQEILVRDGDRVEAGDVLLRLDPTSIAAKLEVIDGQLDELMALRARLVADRLGKEAIEMDNALRARIALRPQAADQLAGQQAIHDATRARTERQVSQLREQIEQIRQQVAGHEAQLEAIDLQFDLVIEELADRQKLFEGGFAPKAPVTELRRRRAELIGERGAAASQAAEAAARSSEIALRILEIEAERAQATATELREVDGGINELREQRVGLAPALQRVEIVAPQAGVVLNMEINTVGGVIAPARPILSIVPDDERLVVETRIDAMSRDQVWPGQEARVKFPGFNQRTTPEIKGIVKTVAADAVIDERTGASFFLAEIDLPEAELDHVRKTIWVSLTPGMPTEVYIKTSERTAGSYLVKPFMDNLDRAFRED